MRNRQNIGLLIKKKLEGKGEYDSTPDTNIERLEKQIIDIEIKGITNPHHHTSDKLLKKIEQDKKSKRSKPIRTSLLLNKR